MARGSAQRRGRCGVYVVHLADGREYRYERGDHVTTMYLDEPFVEAIFLEADGRSVKLKITSGPFRGMKHWTDGGHMRPSLAQRIF